MADPIPEKHRTSPERYERLLRGEITSKQYVASLREQARSSRLGAANAKNGRTAS